MVRVNRRDHVEWRAGMTVQDVLDAMGYDYALLSVFVNGTHVNREDFATHPVPDDAEFEAVHLAHGG